MLNELKLLEMDVQKNSIQIALLTTLLLNVKFILQYSVLQHYLGTAPRIQQLTSHHDFVVQEQFQSLFRSVSFVCGLWNRIDLFPIEFAIFSFVYWK